MKTFFVLLLLLVILVNATSIIRVKSFRQSESFAGWNKTAIGVIEDKVNAFIQETIRDPHQYVCNVRYFEIRGYASAMVSVCQKEQ